MNPILLAAAELQQFLQEHRLRFCVIGGLAVLRWGIPRATQDVDISLYVRPDDEQQIIASLLERFSPRIADAGEFALQNRVLLVKASNEVALDIALAQFDFELEIIHRATSFEYAPGVSLITISADDLVVLKSFAGRDQDWLDVQGIVASQELNRPWIIQQLGLLCELEPQVDALTRLNQLFARFPRS